MEEATEGSTHHDMAPPPPIDVTMIKERQKTMWASGDYAAIAMTINFMSELLCESVEIHAGHRVFDVATGSGNAALAAARRSAIVVGLDFVPTLLDQARRRAEVERLSASFIEGDAENIPFPDGSFDVVLSVVGVMFAPNQVQAANELIRVCRPGGQIGLACWTPDGFAGELFKVGAKYMPPPPGLNPPTRWGTEAGIRELFGDKLEITMTRRDQMLRYLSPEYFAESMGTKFGPLERTYASISPDQRPRLTADLIDLARRHNIAKDGSALIPAAYLEIVATLPGH